MGKIKIGFPAEFVRTRFCKLSKKKVVLRENELSLRETQNRKKWCTGTKLTGKTIILLQLQIVNMMSFHHRL